MWQMRPYVVLIASPMVDVYKRQWVEFYSDEDLTEYNYSSVHNESPKEAYARMLAKK